jgi:hypothetical protein
VEREQELAATAIDLEDARSRTDIQDLGYVFAREYRDMK